MLHLFNYEPSRLPFLERYAFDNLYDDHCGDRKEERYCNSKRYSDNQKIPHHTHTFHRRANKKHAKAKQEILPPSTNSDYPSLAEIDFFISNFQVYLSGGSKQQESLDNYYKEMDVEEEERI